MDKCLVVTERSWQEKGLKYWVTLYLTLLNLNITLLMQTIHLKK